MSSLHSGPQGGRFCPSTPQSLAGPARLAVSSASSRAFPHREPARPPLCRQRLYGDVVGAPSPALIAAAAAAGAGMAARQRCVSTRAYARNQRSEERFRDDRGMDFDAFGREKERFEPHPKHMMKERNRERQTSGKLGNLQKAANYLENELEVTPKLATQMAQRLRSFVIGIEGEDRHAIQTMRWCRKLVRGLAKVPELRQGLLSRGVIKTLSLLQESAGEMLEQVVTLETSHRDISAGKKVDMGAYSEAAAVMGERWWLKVVFGDIANRIDEFYALRPHVRERGFVKWVHDPDKLSQGWRRYQFGKKVYYWNPETKKMQSRLPASVATDPLPTPRDPPVAVLDIGSCYNPLEKYPWLDVTAIDLQPAPGVTSVLKADFFDVPFVDEDDEGSTKTDGASVAVGNAAPAEERTMEGNTGDVSSHADKRGGSQDSRVQLDADGHLIGLRAGSFDVAVISLVLSFLPNEQKRSEMISRARRCLSDDRGLLFVADVPSLLPTGSWYEGDAAQDWTRAIEGLGFKIKYFSPSIKKGAQHQELYYWVFETAPEPKQASTEKLRAAREMR